MRVDPFDDSADRLRLPSGAAQFLSAMVLERLREQADQQLVSLHCCTRNAAPFKQARQFL